MKLKHLAVDIFFVINVLKVTLSIKLVYSKKFIVLSNLAMAYSILRIRFIEIFLKSNAEFIRKYIISIPLRILKLKSYALSNSAME